MSHSNIDMQMSLLLQDIFDAIICDPPYGVRAGGKKSVAKSHKITCAETHIPSTDAYTFEECLKDLLHLAAKHLKLGGRLVFFLPSVPGVDKAGFSILRTVMHTDRNELSSKQSRRHLLYSAFMAIQQSALWTTTASDTLHRICYMRSNYCCLC